MCHVCRLKPFAHSSRKGILQNNYRRSWRSECSPEMNWRVILCVLWFGSWFGADRFPSNGSEQNYLPGHSCNRFPYQTLLQMQANHNKTNKFEIWLPEIKVANKNVRINKINKPVCWLPYGLKFQPSRECAQQTAGNLSRRHRWRQTHTQVQTVF